MPTVPRYDSPQVEPRGIPNVSVTREAPASAFGGGQAQAGLNQAVVGISKDVFDFAQAEKKKADDIAVQDAYTQTVSLKNRLFYDPKEGAITRGGRDVFGIYDEYGSKYDQGTQEIESRLTPDQMQSYRVIRDRQKSDLDNDLNRHVFSQAKKFEDETFKSTIEVTRNDAVLHYQDPIKVSSAIELQKDVIVDYAAKNNLPPEYVKLATEEAVSKTHTSILNRMLANGDDLDAEKYYESIKGNISGEDISSVEKNIKEGSRRGYAQRFADNAVAKSKNMAEALALANDITDVDKRDESEKRIKQYYSDQKAAREQYSDQILGESLVSVQADPRIEAIPPDKWNVMSASDQNTVMARIKQVREGVVKTTDLKKYYEITNIMRDDRQSFIKMNLMRYEPYLSDSDFKKFADMQKDAASGKTAKIDGFMSDQAVVDSILTRLKMDPKAKPKTTAGKKAARFREALDKRVQQYEAQTGKQSTNEDLRRIGNELGVEGVVHKSMLGIDLLLPDETKMQFELEPGQEFDDIVVPKTDSDEISSALRRKGKPVNDDAIKRIYLKGLQSGS